MDHNRRVSDNEGWVAKVIRAWPVLVTLVVLIGSIFVMHSDGVEAKGDIHDLQAVTDDHEKRLIRVEENVKLIPEMRNDIKTIMSLLTGERRRQ